MVEENQIFWILMGVSLAVVLLIVVRRGKSADRVIGNGLVVAALIYVGFAVFSPASSVWLMVEVTGVVVYATLALLGVRRSPIWLGIGWALHIAWDVGLHQYGPGRGFTPFWYPLLCIGFDSVVVFGLALNLKERVSEVKKEVGSIHGSNK